MRYTRQQHLRKSSDFEILRISGIRRECGFFYAQILSVPERMPPVRRLGVVASRRVGNAVIRNRSKRLLRELFRLNQTLLPESCDVVLIARRSIREAKLEDLERRFRKAVNTL